MTYFFHIAYQGSKYSGWQSQKNGLTIQEQLEKYIEKILGIFVIVKGCGRTDAGVHATQYFFHIDVEKPLPQNFNFILNKNLPRDIKVFDIQRMKEGSNARYDVSSRTYDYYLHFYEDPFLETHSSFYPYQDLNVDAMQKAVSSLPTYQDFRSLCRRSHLFPDTTCHVSFSQLFVTTDGKRMRLSITSNRFLQGMIRILVHFILKIGKREISPETFDTMMRNQLEAAVKRQAKPEGLYLTDVVYPYLNTPNYSTFADMLKVGLND